MFVINYGRSMAKNPMIGDSVALPDGRTRTVADVCAETGNVVLEIVQDGITYGVLVSPEGWSNIVGKSVSHRFAEDNQPAVPQERECTCVSLLFGHETKCPMWRKI